MKPEILFGSGKPPDCIGTKNESGWKPKMTDRNWEKIETWGKVARNEKT